MSQLLPLRLVLPLLMLASALALRAESPARGFLLQTLGESDEAGGASGSRLTSGRELLTDDPANEAIYRLLETQVRSLGAQLANGADLASYYRFQDATLAQLIDSLQRIRELAASGEGPSVGEEELGMLRSEIAGLYEDLVSSLAAADFNGHKPFALLAGGLAQLRLTEPVYYRLDGIDRLLAALIRERGIVGAQSAGLELAAGGEAGAREEKMAQQSLGDTEFGAELGRLQRADLRILVELFLAR